MIVAKKLHETEATCNSMILSVRNWPQKAALAEHKTEAVLTISRKKKESVNIRVGGHAI